MLFTLLVEDMSDKEEKKLMYWLKPMVQDHNEKRNIQFDLSNFEDEFNSHRPMLPLDSFDIYFVLRLCQRHDKMKSSILLYLLLGDSISALSISLSIHNRKDAINIAKCTQNELDRKECWLVIAEDIRGGGEESTVPSDEDVKEMLSLVAHSEGLIKIEVYIFKIVFTTINFHIDIFYNDQFKMRLDTNLNLCLFAYSLQDILALLPDDTKLDLFREEVCRGLEESSQEVDRLRNIMDETQETAENISKVIVLAIFFKMLIVLLFINVSISLYVCVYIYFQPYVIYFSLL